MNAIKKILTPAFLFTYYLWCGIAFGQTNILTVENASGLPGSINNTVSISLNNVDTIAGLIFTLNYDSISLTPSRVRSVNRTQNQSGLDFNIPVPGEMVIALFDFEGTNVEPSTGELVHILFDVADTAPAANLAIGISELVLSDASYASIAASGEDGVFQVVDGPVLASPVNLTAVEEKEQIMLNWQAPVIGGMTEKAKSRNKVGRIKGAAKRYSQTTTNKLRLSARPRFISQQPEQLNNGESVTRAIAESELQEFFITVPQEATTLIFKTSNSTGDPDLFVKFGAPPNLDTGDFDFVSDFVAPSEELIIVDLATDPSVQAGDWFVTVEGFEQSNYTLTAIYTEPRALTNGVPVNGNVGQDEVQEFFLTSPAGATSLRVETSNSTGDPDLFMRLAKPPSPANFIFDFSSENEAPNEELIVVDQSSQPAIQAGDWFITVYGFEASAYTLTATHDGTGTGNGPPVLTAIGNKTAVVGELLEFLVTAADPDQDQISLTATNLPGGADFSDNGNGTGKFSWTPASNQVGSFQVTFTANDNVSGTDSETIQITVQEKSGIVHVGYNIYRSMTSNATNTGVRVGNVDAATLSFTEPQPGAGDFFYQVTAVYNRGESVPSNEATVLVTGIEEHKSETVPAAFALRQNYPNPFNPETRILYDLARSTRVRIEIFNLLGQKIRTLVDEEKPAGTFTVVWDGRDDNGAILPSGVYIYRLTTTEFKSSKKLLLLR